MRRLCQLFIVLGASMVAAEMMCYTGEMKQTGEVMDRKGLGKNDKCAKKTCILTATGNSQNIVYTPGCGTTDTCPDGEKCKKDKKDKITCCCTVPLCNGFDSLFAEVFSKIKVASTTAKTSPSGMTTSTGKTTPTGMTAVTTTPNETATTTKAPPTTTGAAMPHGAVVLAATAALLLVLIN